jgi:hypothetical protein
MFTLPESHIRFVAGLSNGETLVEGRGKLERVDGGLAPWHKLQAYIKENNLTINSFGLWIGDRHYNLPSMKPKFGGEIPLGYHCSRKFSADASLVGGSVEHPSIYICAEAIYEDYKVQLWIDEQDDNKVWVNLVQQNNADQEKKS